MKYSIFIKKCYAQILSRIGAVSYKIKRRGGNNFLVLMYHRVIPQTEVKKGIQTGMYVTPESLEMHIRFLKKYFKIVHFQDLIRKNGNRVNKNNQKPSCVLTFDDGWEDFYINAYPILEKHQVPGIVFVPTGLIGTNNWFWTDRLSAILSREKYLTLIEEKNPQYSHIAQKIISLKGSFSYVLDESIQLLKSYRDEVIEEVLACFNLQAGCNKETQNRLFLNWDEIKEMSEEGLISFGSHTVNHRILTTLTKDEIRDELTKSMDDLLRKKVVNSHFVPFCYPNGNYNQQVIDLAREVGYSLAVTTATGWSRFGSNIYTLSRIGLHQDMASTGAMFGCRIAKIL